MTWKRSVLPPGAPLLAGSLLAGALVAGCSAGSGSGTTASPAAGTAGATTSSAAPGGTAAAPTPPASSAAAQKAVPAENNPPGDIPDNLAFVPYRNPAGRYAFTHPEGWSEVTHGTTVTFTDKLNGVTVTTVAGGAAPTVATATARELPTLARTQAAFEAGKVTAVSVPAGKGVKIVYRRNSAPDPVTGRQYRDEVERYVLAAGGRGVVMELFGPVGADNVDAYRTMIQSLRL